MSESFYKKILDFTRAYLNKNKLKGEAEDLISEAFLECPDPSNFELFKKHITRIAIKFSRTGVQFLDLHTSKVHEDKTHICQNCKEELPAYFFNKAKIPPFNINVNCKKCQYQKWKKWARSVDAEHMRELWKKANKKYQSRPEVKEKHKEHVQNKFKEGRETLSDSYIKSLFLNRKANPLKAKDVTPEMIEEKRKEILLSRKEKTQ